MKHVPLQAGFAALVLALFGSCAKNEPSITNEAELRDAVKAGKNLIRLPVGVIELHSEITIPSSAKGMAIEGQGASSVIRLANDFNGRAAFVITGASAIEFRHLSLNGNRKALAEPAGLPPSDVAFVNFTKDNGILAEKVDGLNIRNAMFVEFAGFPVIAAASRNVWIEKSRFEDSGSRNAANKNNTTGGVLFEEGTDDFVVKDSQFRRIEGNAVWTHSLYTSERNSNGRIIGNRFETIGRDAIQIGHATNCLVERNTGTEIGFPQDIVDYDSGAIGVGIDTAGNVDKTVYADNLFTEINGKCIDLDGFHHGDVRGNTCINRRPVDAFYFPGYGIVMNNTNPDMKPEHVRITKNVIEGMHFGAIFIIGENNEVTNNQLSDLNRRHCDGKMTTPGCAYAPDQPDLLRSGIYIGAKAERAAPARGNRIEGNEVSGYQMEKFCVVAGPGVKLADNTVRNNECENEESPIPAN